MSEWVSVWGRGLNVWVKACKVCVCVCVSNTHSNTHYLNNEIDKFVLVHLLRVEVGDQETDVIALQGVCVRVCEGVPGYTSTLVEAVLQTQCTSHRQPHSVIDAKFHFTTYDSNYDSS